MLRRICTCVLPLAPLLTGCSQSPPPPPPKSPEVLVGKPVVREVIDYEYFTGRTEASERVEIRARVTGYLKETFFTEGAEVQENDLLFRIDPRPYAAELARAEAGVIQAEARLKRLTRDYERAQGLVGRQAVSREEFDKLAGDRAEAQAALAVAEAEVEIARLNLGFTEVRAPFRGRVSRRMVDPGNLVKADETVLTTLVATDRMYAYFDVDERTLLRQLLQNGRLDAAQENRLPIQIGLADEEGYPHAGVVNFVDNRVDPNTGTMWLRGEFVKPGREIKPGIFVRVRFPLSRPYQAVLVAEQALGTDQGQKFLYVVDEKNQVSYRPVRVGRLFDGLRVVHQGLKADERVVVMGLQRVRAGATIQPRSVDMVEQVARARGGSRDDVLQPPLPSGDAQVTARPTVRPEARP